MISYLSPDLAEVQRSLSLVSLLLYTVSQPVSTSTVIPLSGPLCVWGASVNIFRLRLLLAKKHDPKNLLSIKRFRNTVFTFNIEETPLVTSTVHHHQPRKKVLLLSYQRTDISETACISSNSNFQDAKNKYL